MIKIKVIRRDNKTISSSDVLKQYAEIRKIFGVTYHIVKVTGTTQQNKTYRLVQKNGIYTNFHLKNNGIYKELNVTLQKV